MDANLFKKDAPGELIKTDLPGYKYAFLPKNLPPIWGWPERLWPLFLEAHTELARLDGVGKHLQSPDLLLRPMQRREAMKSP